MLVHKMIEVRYEQPHLCKILSCQLYIFLISCLMVRRSSGRIHDLLLVLMSVRRVNKLTCKL